MLLKIGHLMKISGSMEWGLY